MSIVDISKQLQAIESALKARPEPTITGSQLFTLISSAAPDLNVRAVVEIPIGPGALTEFVRRHLDGLVERIGNQGGDVLYRIDGRDPGVLPASSSADIWRAFISPSSPLHIILVQPAGRLITRATPALDSNDEREVPKASLDEHDQIRADFTASLPEAESAILMSRAGPDAGFAAWMEVMREHLPDVRGKWGQYRRRRLADLLAARIRGLGLVEPLEQALLAQARAAELSVYGRPKGDAPGASTQNNQRATGRDDAPSMTARARRLAHAAIDLLAYDELRALRMPLGVMLDAMRIER